jgi:hypothetical protein
MDRALNEGRADPLKHFHRSALEGLANALILYG